MAQLRPWSQRAAVQMERTSLLDMLVDAGVSSRETRSLLDLIADEPQAATTEMVAVQLLDWHMVLIPCPACKCYPCKPGHVNGHTETWVPIPGDVVYVAA